MALAGAEIEAKGRNFNGSAVKTRASKHILSRARQRDTGMTLATHSSMTFLTAAMMLVAALLPIAGVGAPLGVVLIVVVLGVLAWERSGDPAIGTSAVRRRMPAAAQRDVAPPPPAADPATP